MISFFFLMTSPFLAYLLVAQASSFAKPYYAFPPLSFLWLFWEF
jgi:hypothetical protein